MSYVKERETGRIFRFMAVAGHFDTGANLAVFCPNDDDHNIHVLPWPEFERRFTGPFADGKEIVP